MTKTEITTETKVESKSPTWPEFVGEEKYAMAIYRLQNEADLTFKEARAVLTPHQLDKALAEAWGCSLENVYNLIRRGYAKVKKITGDDPIKYNDLIPSDLSLAL